MPLLDPGHTLGSQREVSSSTDSNLLWIKLCALDLEAIIGIFPSERCQTQSLTIELQFAIKSADWLVAATSGNLHRSLDYSKVVHQISELATQARFRLLESLYYTLAYLFLRTPHPSEERVQIEALRIHIIKPHALSPNRSPYPCLEGEISRHEWKLLQQKLSSFSINNEHMYKENHEFPSTIVSQVILHLPELTLYYLSSSTKGHFSLSSENQHLILLTDQASCTHRHYTWQAGLSALFISRHESDS